MIIPLLIRRSCHLPGNTWMQDWRQFMQNNHVLLGICLHHRLHPVEWWERCLLLVGSVCFGLSATTLAYLYDRRWQPEVLDNQLFAVWHNRYVITYGDIVLWTMGCLLHSTFDIFMWNIMACACCHAGGRYGNSRMSKSCKDCGSYLMIPVVIFLLTLCAWVVIVRASHPSAVDENGNVYFATDDLNLNVTNIENAKAFSFLFDYALELVLAWVIYSPIVATIYFSGAMSCNGCIPLIGGRPADKAAFEENFDPDRKNATRYASF